MSAVPEYRECVTVREIPDYFHGKISLMTVYRWIESGELEARGPKYWQRVTRESLARKLSQWPNHVPAHMRAMVQPKRGIKAELWNEQNGRCWYCCKSLLPRFNIDHVNPRSKGGRDVRGNYRLACEPCNRRKRATSATAFAVSLLT